MHAIAPRHVSFLAFCAANVLIDIEPLYYLLSGQEPLHRFMHTYAGATLVAIVTIAIFMLALRAASVVTLPNLFRWQALNFRQVAVGAAAGSYSHIVLDSIMHADIRPLAPFSQANGLYGVVSLEVLHNFCWLAGALAVVLLAWRRLFFARH